MRVAWGAESSRRTHDLSRALREDLSDGKLDSFSLLEAATVASGVESPVGLAQTCHAVQLFSHQLRERIALADGDKHDGSHIAATARQLLNELHGGLLKGEYKAECTEVQVAVREGNFNCVSSTVLYVVLARDLGLDSQAIAAPLHVVARIRGPRDFTVQTTRPVPRELVFPVADRLSSTESDGRALSDAALVGKIYYNRAVSALEERRFSDAIELARLALACDSDDTYARQNLLASLNNRALQLADANEYKAAAQHLAEARALDAKWPLLAVNDVHIHHRWAVSLCIKGDASKGIALLQSCGDRNPERSEVATALASLRRAYGE